MITLFYKLHLRGKLLLAFGLFACLVASVGFIGYHYVNDIGDKGYNTGAKLAPLGQAIKSLQLSAMRAHLLFEEILAGDAEEDINDVWRLLDESLFYCDAIIDGASKDGMSFIATEDKQLRAKMQAVRDSIVAFIKAGRHRHAHYNQAGIGSEADQRFDALYEKIQTSLSNRMTQHENNASIQSHAGQAKYLLANGHLFLEELLTGDESNVFTTIISDFEHARRHSIAAGADQSIIISIDEFIKAARQRNSTFTQSVGAGTQADQDFDAQFDHFINLAHDAQDMITKAILADISLLQENISTSNSLLIFSTLLGLGLALTLAYFLSMLIAVPIQRITKNMQRLEGGKIDLQTIDYPGKDELNDLIKASKGMGERIQEAITQAHCIAEGDYRINIKPRSDQDELGIALQNMILTLREMAQLSSTLAEGDFSITVNVKGEFDQLGTAMAHMTQVLKANDYYEKQQSWLKSNVADTARLLQNQTDSHALANSVMQQLPEILQASHGAFYVMRDDAGSDTPVLALEGSYAFKGRNNISNHFKLGEGLIGQCGLEQRMIVLTQVPDDYIKIKSGLGESTPNQIIVVPLLAENTLMGVMELATTGEFSSIQKQFLEQINDSIGISLYTVKTNHRTSQLLEASQSMTEELQAQQEELREANETLESRAEELSASEEELRSQQEALIVKNDELVAQNETVEAQKRGLTASAESLALKANELQQASQYKSDFLSNMSHELRTPLNSLLILSDMLAKNKDGNLTNKQVEFAATIHGSGADLLELINSILDLAKVEAGKMDLDAHRFPLHDLSDAMQRDFTHVADKKGVGFRIEFGDDTPEMMFSDAMRIKQVLKNLLSNALKFTSDGDVLMRIERVDDAQISFAVIDTGVGIAADKMNAVFEAFQQEDGSTSRKYGGTGLGLSICRELSKLLGGRITVQSEQSKGSTFALIIPIECAERSGEQANPNSEAIIAKQTSEAVPNISTTNAAISLEPDSSNIEQLPNPLNDDRDNITAKDLTILIIEDDESFAAIQQGLVQEHGFKAINALRGDHGLMLAQQYVPDAILLDLQLPVLDGMSLLDRLKQHPRLRHIPVHVISCMDQGTEKRVLQAGAISFVHKPANQDDLNHIIDSIGTFIQRDVKRLLIVEDDDNQLQAMSALLEANDVDILSATTGADTLDILRNNQVDCMILDLTLPDMSGEDVLAVIEKEADHINQGHVLPIIVHTGKELSEEEVEKLQGMAKSIIVKGSYSPDRLLAETSLFLHQVETEMPDDKQDRIERVRKNDVDMSDRTVLLVDDDIRNIYSLSSYLEGIGLTVHTARNGIEALATLKEHAEDIELALMDIMMPEMDGYECMQEIRKIKAHQNLPIIALTAKAMKGDREQCIASGASDYITKPVDTDQLMSLIRVWLYE